MTYCRCGCPDSVHHTSWTFATNGDGERVWSGYLFGECLRYGSNETGGMRPTMWHRLFPPPRGELGALRQRLAAFAQRHGAKWYRTHCMGFVAA